MRWLNRRTFIYTERPAVFEGDPSRYLHPLLCSDFGPSQETQNKEMDISNRQLALGEHQQQQADELRGISLPGFKKAADYYNKLSSGDSNEIFRAIAPAAETVSAQTDALKKQIQDNMPRGGESRLAQEGADISKTANIGGLVNKSYTSSFPAMASMGSTGLGLSLNQIANALSGYGGAATTTGNLGQQQAEGKATTMGFIGQAMGAGASMAGAACWIAEALYGINDCRTHLLRIWLNREFAKSRFGAAVMALYRKHGIAIAEVVRRNRAARYAMQPLFDLALSRAVARYA